MLELSEIGGRIAVTGDTYPVADLLKVIPGYRWEKALRAWTYPLTPHSLNLLKTAFPDARSTLVDLETKTDLLKQAMEAKAADRFIPFETRMRPWLHQMRSFYFAKYRLMAQGGAMLALDMGTGKSKVTIDLINEFDCKRVLITCPPNVMDVWPEQFEEHSPAHHRVYVCNRKHSVARRWKEAEQFMEEHHGCGIVVVNHEAVWMPGFRNEALAWPWDMLVVDECHRAKLASGKLSRYLHRLSKHIPLRLGLTGTPCPHSIDDFYAQARFIDESVHGTNHQVYKSKYMVQIPGHNDSYQKVIGFKNMDDWNEKFHSMAIRVEADDVLDLPACVHTTRYCDLSPEEETAYNDMKHELIAEVKGGVITAANALVKLLRLAQIVQGTVTNAMGDSVEIGVSKKTVLIDTFHEIPTSEPVIVFCRFKCDLKNIKLAAARGGRDSYELSGACKELDEWKANGGVLAVQIQSGGVGISMVQAKYCIYMSKDFSLGNYEQSLARIKRPGQNRNVTYIHILARGTIDETINKALAQRKDTIEAILEEMGS
ncbi:MAG TPA: DEAD/DEAH box helicase [Anaerolineae bacterium]|nr:DEAD/DEAH box helicase [Anaerolineae bacterium]